MPPSKSPPPPLQALSVKSAANLVTLHDHYVMVPEAIAAMEEREAALDNLFSLQVRGGGVEGGEWRGGHRSHGKACEGLPRGACAQ